MRRLLLIIGVLLLVAGIAWPRLVRANWWRWLGHLPGDIHIEREGFSFHFPIVTCILLSVAVTVIISLARRFLG